MGTITVLTGGAKSGKSRYSLEIASKYNEQKIFIATAINFDQEMNNRIQKHRIERQSLNFKTVEEPFNLSKVIQEHEDYPLIIVDCLTLWINNLLYSDEFKNKNIAEFIETEICKIEQFSKTTSCELIFITNEVGSGIVPLNKLAREFRDTQGMVNQKFAKISNQLILMVSGYPLIVKGE